MANLFQYELSIIQSELIIFSITIFVLGCVLVSLRHQKQHDRRWFHEDLQPVRHYGYRRKVGIGYMAIAIIAAVVVFLNPSVEENLLYPFWGLALASINTLFTTAVLLTLIYASRKVFLMLLVEGLLLAALLWISEAITLTDESLLSIWSAVFGVTFVFNIIIYIRSRQRFLRTMFGIMGSDAIDFRMPRMKYMLIPSILLSGWSALACAIPAIACLPAIIGGLSTYYIALNIYYRYHSEEIAVVEEIMVQEFDWKHTSDEQWRRILSDY